MLITLYASFIGDHSLIGALEKLHAKIHSSGLQSLIIATTSSSAYDTGIQDPEPFPLDGQSARHASHDPAESLREVYIELQDCLDQLVTVLVLMSWKGTVRPISITSRDKGLHIGHEHRSCKWT